MNALEILPPLIGADRIELRSDSVSLWPYIERLTPDERRYIITSWKGWDSKNEVFLAEQESYCAKYVRHYENSIREQGLRAYWLYGRENNRLVGHFIAHTPPGDYPNVLAISYTVFENYRRRGFAAEAIRFFSDYALEVGASHICAEPQPDNPASTNALRRADFKCAGRGMATLIPSHGRYANVEGIRYMKTRDPALTAWPIATPP